MSLKSNKTIDTHQAVIQRALYERVHLKFLYIVVVLLLVTTGLSTFSAWMSIRQSEQVVYFTATEDGRLLPISPLTERHYGNAYLREWVTEALIDIYDVNFRDIEDHLRRTTQVWFTSTGGPQFIEAMMKSGNIETLKKERLFLSLVVAKTPLITERGIIKGRYTWRIQVPVLMTYRNNEKEMTRSRVMTIVVQRRSPFENASGLGIKQIIEGGT